MLGDDNFLKKKRSLTIDLMINDGSDVDQQTSSDESKLNTLINSLSKQLSEIRYKRKSLKLINDTVKFIEELIQVNSSEYNSKFNKETSIDNFTILKLLRNSYFCSSLIDYYTHIIASYEPNSEIIILPTYFYQILLTILNTDSIDTIRNKLKSYLKDKSLVYIIPICHDNHWMLITTNFNNNMITLYNSLETTSDDTINIIKQINKVFKKYYSLNMNLITSINSNFRQENSYDCGAFVCYLISRLYNNRRLIINQSRIDIYKFEMACDIVNSIYLK